MPIYAQTKAKAFWDSLKEGRSRTLAASYFAPVKGAGGEQDSGYKKDGVDAISKGVAESGFCDSWQDFAKSIPGAKVLLASLQSRLLVNMAGSILENAGVSLEFASGIPVIPGSAVKGAARRYALALLQETASPAAKQALLQDILDVFGCTEVDFDKASDLRWAMGGLPLPEAPNHTGGVCFLQAVPETDPEICMDVLTPHHQKYMAGAKDKATDSESPVPSFFPAIGASLRKAPVFCFTLCPKGNSPRAHELVELAATWLKEGVSLFGIGAKTAAGYGQFQFMDETKADMSPELREAVDFIVNKKNLTDIFKDFMKHQEKHPLRIQALLSMLAPGADPSRRADWIAYRDTPPADAKARKQWDKKLNAILAFAQEQGVDLTPNAD